MNASIAIMQPYVFPYIGYFQLIDAVDTFVFYDDVHFIKKGWIHRNRLLMDGKDYLFTIPLQKASQNKLINEIKVLETEAWLDNWYRTLYQCYAKAPYFIPVMELLRNIMDSSSDTISELAIKSIKDISSYIGLSTSFEVSSETYSDSKGMEKADRLIAIT
ncbi:MAG: WbqC family protein, partial [Flavobacteriaceae bacterium]|nr:WbqC family protein [Flavobacteriaceae bacterium]